MSHYIEAIKRLFHLKELLIGLLFLAIPFVNIVTGIFASGYIVESARMALHKRKGLPKWKHLGELFIQGIMISIISLAYSLPVILLMIVSAMGFAYNTITMEGAGFVGTILVLTGLLGILTAYVLPSATLSYCSKRKLKDAFSSEVFSKTARWSYLVDWIFAMVYSFLLAMLAAFFIMWGWHTIIIPNIAIALFVFISGITNLSIIAERY